MYYDDFEMRTKLQKILLLLLAAMAVVFCVLTFVSRSHRGLHFSDMLMEVSQEGDTSVYTGEKSGYDVTIRHWEENGAHYVDYRVGSHIHQLGKLEYPEGTVSVHGTPLPRLRISRDGTTLFDGCYNPNATGFGRYYKTDGSPELFVSITVTTSNGPAPDPELTAGNILFFAEGPELSARGSWGGYFLCLLLTAIMAVSIAFPYALFRWRYHFSVRDPEPTDFYLFMHRLGSVIATAVILILYISALREIVPL